MKDAQNKNMSHDSVIRDTKTSNHFSSIVYIHSIRGYAGGDGANGLLHSLLRR